MYRQKIVCLTFALVAVLFVCVVEAYAQEEVERAKAPFKPVEPPRLYVAPTADIIPSLDLSVAAGGALGENAFSYQGTAALGLAGIAQIEANAINIGSSFKEGGLGNVYSPGFKMMLLRTGKWRHSSGISTPGLAWALHSSIPREEEENKITYETKVANLYFVATERLGPLSVHGGLDIINARLKVGKEGGEEVNENFYRPFGGMDLWVTERGKAMFEVGSIPDFQYTEKEIKPIWVYLFGVRFFATRYIAADVGVRYQSNYEGVSDANIEFKIDTSIPTHLLYEYARGNR